MAKYKIATPAGASFTTSGGGYDYEMEALEGIDAEIVEGPANEDGFIAFARDADAVYVKGMRFGKKVIDGLGDSRDVRDAATADAYRDATIFRHARDEIGLLQHLFERGGNDPVLDHHQFLNERIVGH